MRLHWLPVLAFAGLVLLPGVASAQPDTPEVTLDQTRIVTSVGRHLTIESRITNRTGAPLEGLLAHINVASADGTYVDLEDWSAEVTRPVDTVAPGESTAISWELQAVNAGNFHVYVVLLPTNGPPVASPSARVQVGEKRTLNAGGALPIAIVIPTLLGFGAIATRVRVRNRTA